MKIILMLKILMSLKFKLKLESDKIKLFVFSIKLGINIEIILSSGSKTTNAGFFNSSIQFELYIYINYCSPLDYSCMLLNGT